MGTPQTGDDLIASYSRKGPTALDFIVKPDVVTPGNRITSILAKAPGLQRSPFDHRRRKICLRVPSGGGLRHSAEPLRPVGPAIHPEIGTRGSRRDDG